MQNEPSHTQYIPDYLDTLALIGSAIMAFAVFTAAMMWMS